MTGSPQPSGTDAEHATVQLHVAALHPSGPFR